MPREKPWMHLTKNHCHTTVLFASALTSRPKLSQASHVLVQSLSQTPLCNEITNGDSTGTKTVCTPRQAYMTMEMDPNEDD